MNRNGVRCGVRLTAKALLLILTLSVVPASYADEPAKTTKSAKQPVVATSTTEVPVDPAVSTNAVTNTEIDEADDEAAVNNEDTAPIPDTKPAVAEKDPYEGFNRAMFTFNDKLDIFILKPIATIYNKIMPIPLNKGIHNVFFNINTIPTVADDILQANFYQATNDIWRIGINTTIGIGGLFDVAERMNLEPYSNDFGLTLARWGYTNSDYLVLPFFGPNTLRDGLIGLPVDYFAFSLYPYMEPPSFRYQVYGLGVIDKRAQLLKFEDVVDEASYDKYVFVRNAYLQRRAAQIEENNHRSCCDRKADASASEAVTADGTVTTDVNTDADVKVSAASSKASDENYD